MRHFAHHIGDYAAATAHLSFVEDAAYHRLLRRYYQDERALPADLAATQRLVGARTKDERAAVDAVLREFFVLEDDGWHQSRADKEIEAYQNRAETARQNGTNGGRPPKPKHNPEETERVLEKKLTNSHEPITKNQEPSEEDISSAFALFNDAAKRTGWPEAQKLDDTRKKKMLARLKDVGGIDGFAVAIGKAEASEFLTVTWPNFNIDWLLKPANFTKLMEGNYDKRAESTGSARGGISADFAAAAAALRDKQYHGL